MKQIIYHDSDGFVSLNVNLSTDLYNYLLELIQGDVGENMDQFDYQIKILDILFLSSNSNDENIELRLVLYLCALYMYVMYTGSFCS